MCSRLSVVAVCCLVLGCQGLLLDPVKMVDGSGAGSGSGSGTGSGTGMGAGEGGSGGGDSFGPQPQFSCTPNQTPDELPLKRLSAAQYRNTITDLVRSAAGSNASAVLSNLEPLLNAMPNDLRVTSNGERHGGFERLDQAVQQGHVDASYEVAVRLGQQLTRPTARLTTLMGSCATDGNTGNDAQCLTTFVRTFGERALRRPLPTEDVTFFAAVAGSTPVAPDAVADVVALLLTSPYFLYHVEHGGPAPSANATYPLDGYELASRLSYHFWQSAPDAALLAAAADGSLLTPEGYAAQTKRLFDDPRTDAALDSFFNQWWRLYELDRLDSRLGDPLYESFRGALRPTPTLHLEMQADVTEMARTVAREGSNVSALLTESRAFARTETLATVYGVAPWSGSGTAPKPQAERVGLLTRPAMVANMSANTRPIIKGFHIRNALLCETVPPPPANVNATPPDLSPTATTREVVEGLTEQTGTSCAGCHQALINPLGFATENIDALGRVRAQYSLFDAQGVMQAQKPVDTTSVPKVFAHDTRPSSGAGDLTRYLDESGKFHSCLARQYFRFTFGRQENEQKDGCALSALEQAAQSGQSLAEVLMAAALRPEFRQRNFGGTP